MRSSGVLRVIKKIKIGYDWVWRSIKLIRTQRKDARFFRQLGQFGRPGIYTDSSVSSDSRVREKAWWWLTQEDAATPQHWLEYWFEKHPAKDVGTHNIDAREKWLEKTLKSIPRGKKILDAGAGELQYKRFCEHLEYVSQDFAQYTGEGNHSGLQMGTWDNTKLDIVSDITSIPLKDNSFDAIMCIEVFEHIPRPLDALKEFHRILKPGGTLIITTPFAALTHFAPYFFYNGYSQYFYEKLLPEFNFSIKELSLNGNYFEYIAQELRRVDEMASKYAPTVGPPSYMDELTKHWVIRRLEKLSRKDRGSSEVLVHGIHIVASKDK